MEQIENVERERERGWDGRWVMRGGHVLKAEENVETTKEEENENQRKKWDLGNLGRSHVRMR